MKKKRDIKEDSSNILEVKKISKDSKIPEYILESDIGLDLTASENVNLLPMEQKAIKTGILIKIPKNHVGLIRDRAGIVSKMNVHTSAGTFDPDYRGEVSVMMINFSDEEITIEKGMRIAQLLIIPVIKVKVKEVKELSKTERGERSFGSTGIKEKIKILNELSKKIKR